jgi:hypothetical protein
LAGAEVRLELVLEDFADTPAEGSALVDSLLAERPTLADAVALVGVTAAAAGVSFELLNADTRLGFLGNLLEVSLAASAVSSKQVSAHI